MDSTAQQRAYRLRLGPRYVSKYSEGGEPTVEKDSEKPEPNDTKPPAPALRGYASKLKTTRRGYFNDVEKGDHGSDTSSGSGDSDQDSADSDDVKDGVKKEKSPKAETPSPEPKRDPSPVPAPAELISVPRSASSPEIVYVPLASVTPRVTGSPLSGTTTAQPTETTSITTSPIVLTNVELQYKRLESEILTLKEFLQETEKKKIKSRKNILDKNSELDSRKSATYVTLTAVSKFGRGEPNKATGWNQKG